MYVRTRTYEKFLPGKITKEEKKSGESPIVSIEFQVLKLAAESYVGRGSNTGKVL